MFVIDETVGAFSSAGRVQYQDFGEPFTCGQCGFDNSLVIVCFV